MTRLRLFLENIFSYGFISVLNRVVPFLLLPIITRILPNTSDFGVFSLYTTIVGFGTYFAILGLYDAMFREFFESKEKDYKYNVTTTTQRMILISSFLVSFLLIIFRNSLSILFFGERTFNYILILAGVGVFINANKSPIGAPTRMQNQRKIYIFSGLLSSLINYVGAIILIYLGYSYFGLIYANIFSGLILLCFFFLRNYKYFTKGKFDKVIAKKLLQIGLPLLPTFIVYWLYNSMDKIMIANLLDTSELGVYSIGSKIGQISLIVYSAFVGGYSYFKYSTMKDNDQISMNSKLFEYMFTISIVAFVVITPFMPILFEVLFVGDYINGYLVAPYLFLSPLILMSFQIVASQFVILRKSYIISLALFFGASLNIILNYFLIKYFGIIGASIATVTGYLSSLIIIIIVAHKTKQLFIKKRIFIVGTILFIYLILIISSILNLFVLIILSTTFIIIIISLFRDDIKILILNVKSLKKKEGSL